MSVRCKVVCNTKTEMGGQVNVTLCPVYSGSEENKRFFAATPGGQFQFYSVNKEATDQLEIGKEYYLDLSPAS